MLAVTQPIRLEIRNIILINDLLLLLHATTYVPIPYIVSESWFYILHTIVSYSLVPPSKLNWTRVFLAIIVYIVVFWIVKLYSLVGRYQQLGLTAFLDIWYMMRSDSFQVRYIHTLRTRGKMTLVICHNPLLEWYEVWKKWPLLGTTVLRLKKVKRQPSLRVSFLLPGRRVSQSYPWRECSFLFPELIICHHSYLCQY
jgi:hypothetical protein